MNGIENLLATIEAMSVRCKPGGRLAELLADLQAQRRQQEGEGETHLLYKFQVSSFFFFKVNFRFGVDLFIIFFLV